MKNRESKFLQASCTVVRDTFFYPNRALDSYTASCSSFAIQCERSPRSCSRSLELLLQNSLCWFSSSIYLPEYTVGTGRYLQTR